MAKKLENMDDTEFMDAWTAAAENLEAAKEKVREFSAEHQRRERFADIQRRMDLNDEESAALAQAFSVKGIESQESVNNG
jgi:hypothetical protein